MNFQDLSPDDLRNIWVEKLLSNFILSNSIANITDIPLNYFDNYKEVAPTPLALVEKNFAKIIYYSTDDINGRWMRFVLFVYAKGGKILYKRRDDSDFDIKIVW